MYFSKECLFDLYSTHLQPHTLTQQFIETAITSIGSEGNFCHVFSYFCTILNVSQLKIVLTCTIATDIDSRSISVQAFSV